METQNDRKRALLATDGSVTALLEAFTGSKIRVIGLKQDIKPAGQAASDLDVKTDERVNVRHVSLVDSRGKTLVYAISYTPLSRLDTKSRRDILGTDMPIGRILKKHRIESRREIIGRGFKKDREIAAILNIKQDAKIPYRRYLIIHRNKPLMRIEEYLGDI